MPNANQPPLRSAAIRLFLTLCLASLPKGGHCDTGSAVSSSGLFGMNDVAVKVGEVSERDHNLIVYALAFSPDGKRLAVDSDYENINVWDWRKNRIETTITKPQGFGGSQTANPLTFSPDGRLLADCEGPGAGNVVVRIWDTTTWQVAEDIIDAGPSTSESVNFTPDGQFLVRSVARGGSPGDALIIYSVGAWHRIRASPMQSEFSPFSLAVSPDGRFAAIGGLLMSVPPGIVDLRERIRQLKHERTIRIIGLQQLQIVKEFHGDAMGPLAWTPDGARVAVAGSLYVEMFDARTGERLVHDKVEKSGTMNVRFTPDGRYFIESDLNGMGKGLGVKIWDGFRRKVLQEIPGDIGSIALSQDGKYLAVGATGRVTVWQFK
jgi:WD40 repeat protein